MTLARLLPDDFVTGVARYSDNIPGSDDVDPRIVLNISFGSGNPMLTIVDTGAPLCILDPEEATTLDIDYAACPSQSYMNIRGHKIFGLICRIPMTVWADQGENAQIEAAVFIPQLDPNGQWRLPNFLGMSGLNRLRFAVDPTTNLFYFSGIE